MADEGTDVTVEVDVETADETPDDGGGDTIVVTPPAAPAGGVDGDLVAMLASFSERLAVVEQAVTLTANAAAEAQTTADMAAADVERVAVETEEAVAAVAEEADAATAEVADEVDDIAPDREHPWFAGRKLFGRKGGGDQ